jgi:hypothetical protein
MKSPRLYDDKTEELLGWFEDETDRRGLRMVN